MISPLEGDTKEPELHKRHTDLKQRMRDLNHGLERLRKLSHEGFTEDSGEPKLSSARGLESQRRAGHLIFGEQRLAGASINTFEREKAEFCLPSAPHKSCYLPP